MAPAEQDDVDDEHDSGLDGGPGGGDAASDDIDDLDEQDMSWVGRTRDTTGAEIPENGLSRENLMRFTRADPGPSGSHDQDQQSSGQHAVALQDAPVRESVQMVLRLRGDRSQSSEQQGAPQDGLARRTEQQDTPEGDPAQIIAQQTVTPQDDSEHNSATDAASDN